MEKGPARRCSMGCETYPDKIIFRHCLECGEETERISNGIPMSLEEAERKLLYHLFDEFYAKWCQQHQQPVEGPLPEKPGRLIAEVADSHQYE